MITVMEGIPFPVGRSQSSAFRTGLTTPFHNARECFPEQPGIPEKRLRNIGPRNNGLRITGPGIMDRGITDRGIMDRG